MVNIDNFIDAIDVIEVRRYIGFMSCMKKPKQSFIVACLSEVTVTYTKSMYILVNESEFSCSIIERDRLCANK